jgi:hypothetical protein
VLLLLVEQHLLPVAGVLQPPKVAQLVGLRLAVHQGRRLGQGEVLPGCLQRSRRCGSCSGG